MSFWQYWQLVCARAVKEATASVGLSIETVRRLLLSSAAGVALSWVIIDWSNAVMTAVSVFVGVILANAAVASLMFLVKLAQAPVLIHREQEAKILELAPVRARNDLAEVLGQQDDFAVHNLWARPPSGSGGPQFEQFQAWAAEIERWVIETVEIMKNGGCTAEEVRSFRTLGDMVEFRNPAGRDHVDGQVNTELVKLRGRRKRLAAIIAKYSQG